MSLLVALVMYATIADCEPEQSPICNTLFSNDCRLNENVECIGLIYPSQAMAILSSSNDIAMFNMHHIINNIQSQNTLIHNSEVIALNDHPNEHLDLGWCGNAYIIHDTRQIFAFSKTNPKLPAKILKDANMDQKHDQYVVIFRNGGKQNKATTNCNAYIIRISGVQPLDDHNNVHKWSWKYRLRYPFEVYLKREGITLQQLALYNDQDIMQLYDGVDDTVRSFRDSTEYVSDIDKEKFMLAHKIINITTFQRVYHWKLPEVAERSNRKYDIGFEYSDIYGLIFIQSTSDEYRIYTLSMTSMDETWSLRANIQKSETQLDIINSVCCMVNDERIFIVSGTLEGVIMIQAYDLSENTLNIISSKDSQIDDAALMSIHYYHDEHKVYIISEINKNTQRISRKARRKGIVLSKGENYRAEYYDINNNEWHSLPSFDVDDNDNYKKDCEINVVLYDELLCVMSQKWNGIISFNITDDKSEWKWIQDKNGEVINVMKLMGHSRDGSFGARYSFFGAV